MRIQKVVHEDIMTPLDGESILVMSHVLLTKSPHTSVHVVDILIIQC